MSVLENADLADLVGRTGIPIRALVEAEREILERYRELETPHGVSQYALWVGIPNGFSALDLLVQARVFRCNARASGYQDAVWRLDHKKLREYAGEPDVMFGHRPMVLERDPCPTYGILSSIPPEPCTR